MLIPLLLFYALPLGIYGLDPASIYLYSQKSFINYTAEYWKLHDVPTEITIALSYQLNSNGQIFAVRFIEPNDGQQSYKLSISVYDSRYIVSLQDVNYNTVDQESHDFEQKLDGTHTLYTKITTDSVSLILDESHQKEQLLQNQLIQLRKDDTISLIIGGGGESAIGCIQFKHLSVSGVPTLPHDLHEVEHSNVDTCDAIQDCSKRDCGEGKCVQEEVATCDCFGTGKTGPNCKDEPRSLRLRNDDDDAKANLIKFENWGNTKISRIALHFEYADPNDMEGVLLHSILNDGSSFKLYVVNDKGQLTVGTTNLNFTLNSESKLHKLEIEIGTEISLTVDGSVKTCTTPAGLAFPSLTIGGVQADSPDGTREIGITACFPLIYVDHYDIIDHYFNGDPKVKAPSPLSACSNEPFISDGAKMFAPDNEQFGVYPLDDDKMSDSMEGLGLFDTLKKKPALSSCERAEQYVCRHDSVCEKNEGYVSCTCKVGYGGRYCQFTLMPRTCAEAQLWKLPEGPTRLDLDGLGILTPSIAMCRNGKTILSHDMPTSTAIRDASFLNHSLFIVSYLDFTPEKVASLVEQSSDCSQTINYACNRAPLNFAGYQTWFQIAYRNGTLRQMDKVPNSCACLDTGCARNGKCNCDSGSITSDTGILTGKNAGITRVIALMGEGHVSGQMTLGQLQCSGNDGTAIKFNKLNSLHLGDWNGQSLSFHFATANSSAQLAEIYEAGKELNITLIDGHMVELKIEGNEKPIIVESQAKLNDSTWHSLILEVVEGEIRLSIDGIHQFAEIDSDILPSGHLIISHPQQGFIGALRDVRINGEFVDLYTHMDGVIGVARYNGGRCSETKCHNGALCIEDFINDSFLCRCKYPNIHSGKNCEIDLNKESSISLHGGKIRIVDTTSPLEHQTLLSFRTDQHNALILFAHDENNNFVQLHLSNETNLTLTVNNEDVVSSCSVSARIGKEFANMEWIQISIEHSSNSSTLIVEEDVCVIRANRKLATSPIKRYSHVETEIAVIPVGFHPVVDAKPFIYTFIGGVERKDTNKDGNVVLEPLYQSPIHNLKGCVRGLKIGDEVLNLRTQVTDESVGVRMGCDITCIDCYNGGHCAADWTVSGSQSALTPACDCARTSYEGLSCNVDDGLHLGSQNSTFIFRVSPILRRTYASRKGRQEVRFAFSTSQNLKHQPAVIRQRQSLANLYFTDASYFEFVINKNSTLNVGYVDTFGKARVLNFNEHFADGYRHFVRMRFGEKNRTTIIVDTLSATFSHAFDEVAPNLFDADRIQFAIVRETELIPSSQIKKPFEGCISNVVFDYNINPPLILRPISYYFNETHEYHEYTTSTGEIAPGKCSSFRSPDFLTSQKNPLEMPVWDTNFARLDYTGPVEKPPADGNTWWWIIIIIVGILILLLLAFCIYRVCCKKEEGRSIPVERVPLNRPAVTKNIYAPPPINPQSNYRIPEPKINLDGERLSGRSTPTHGSNDSEDDADTIRHIDDDGDIVYVNRPNDLDALADRERPHRVSSFRQGDSTVPRASPLYSPSSSRPTVIPVPPPVPPPRITEPVRSSN